jgi:hypothetical protein
VRSRATLAAVTGALALSAFAVPAAQADDNDGKPYPLNLTFSNVKINNGKPVVMGTSGGIRVPGSFTLKHPVGFDLNDPWLHLSLRLTPVGSTDDRLVKHVWAGCAPVTATTAACSSTMHINPSAHLANRDATTYNISGHAIDWNGQGDPADDDDTPIDWDKVGVTDQQGLGTVKFQRLAKLAVNAGPEPVRQGKPVTVIGKLTRANWDTHYYGGIANQSVKLQFKKKGTTSWTTLKTVKSSTTGALSTTTTATYDGYYRYSYAGATTTSAAVSAADYVDVQTAPASSGDVVAPKGPDTSGHFAFFTSGPTGNGPVVSDMSVNGGKNVIVGSGTARTFTVSVTASHPSGVADARVHLWRGSDAKTDVEGLLLPNEDTADCTASGTTATCKLTVTARPGLHNPEGVGDLFANYLSGSWRVAIAVKGKDGSLTSNMSYDSVKVQRGTALTLDVTPEPPRRGQLLTAKGKLIRADWETGTYGPLAGQTVHLEYRKQGATDWTSVQQAGSDAKGLMSTVTEATYDGAYRFSYEANPRISTNGPSVSREDAVDVQ